MDPTLHQGQYRQLCELLGVGGWGFSFLRYGHWQRCDDEREQRLPHSDMERGDSLPLGKNFAGGRGAVFSDIEPSKSKLQPMGFVQFVSAVTSPAALRKPTSRLTLVMLGVDLAGTATRCFPGPPRRRWTNCNNEIPTATDLACPH
jgi:hypothetical protein